MERWDEITTWPDYENPPTFRVMSVTNTTKRAQIPIFIREGVATTHAFDHQAGKSIYGCRVDLRSGKPGDLGFLISPLIFIKMPQDSPAPYVNIAATVSDHITDTEHPFYSGASMRPTRLITHVTFISDQNEVDIPYKIYADPFRHFPTEYTGIYGDHFVTEKEYLWEHYGLCDCMEDVELRVKNILDITGHDQRGYWIGDPQNQYYGMSTLFCAEHHPLLEIGGYVGNLVIDAEAEHIGHISLNHNTQVVTQTSPLYTLPGNDRYILIGTHRTPFCVLYSGRDGSNRYQWRHYILMARKSGTNDIQLSMNEYAMFTGQHSSATCMSDRTPPGASNTYYAARITYID